MAIRLHELAVELAFPIEITSGYRDDDSSHNTRDAADIRVYNGWQRYTLVRLALQHGFKRIGVYDKHIHLDIRTDRPRPVIWQGTSK